MEIIKQKIVLCFHNTLFEQSPFKFKNNLKLHHMDNHFACAHTQVLIVLTQ